MMGCWEVAKIRTTGEKKDYDSLEFMRRNHSLCTLVVMLNRLHLSIGRASTPQSLYYCLFALCLHILVLRAHPVRGESHMQPNATGEVAQHPLLFTANRTDRTFFLWKLNPVRPSHPGHSTILLRSESPSGMCAKLHTMGASINGVHTP